MSVGLRRLRFKSDCFKLTVKSIADIAAVTTVGAQVNGNSLVDSFMFTLKSRLNNVVASQDFFKK